jgi:putative ABC transport system ATP-binding protein
MRPELLLTDEMTGNLDAVTGKQVMELIGKLHSKFGMAVVSVTHDQNLASLYPKTYRLEDGKLLS